MKNAISVDVEEYYHAANLESVAGPALWRKLPSRVELTTRKVLEIFERRGTKATFFVLGVVASRHPHLVKEIATAGHEIASHGFAHRTAYEQTQKQFARDISRSKHLLEDITGKPVLGYRAPSFSITPKNLWAYDELVKAGYRYDSSLYPVKHHRYGNLGRPLLPHFYSTVFGELLVLPLAVCPLKIPRLLTLLVGKLGGRLPQELRLPVAGGAYWRVFPRWYVQWGLKKINNSGHHPFICYFHPWELDPEQPHYAQLPFLTRMKHYTGLSGFSNTVDLFIKTFSFDSIRNCYLNND